MRIISQLKTNNSDWYLNSTLEPYTMSEDLIADTKFLQVMAK